MPNDLETQLVRAGLKPHAAEVGDYPARVEG